METPMSTTYLKIKIKSLAAEARMIRHEETRWKIRSKPYRREQSKNIEEWLADKRPTYEVSDELKPLTEANNIFWGLRSHRTSDVRVESRAALLAYGML